MLISWSWHPILVKTTLFFFDRRLTIGLEIFCLLVCSIHDVNWWRKFFLQLSGIARLLCWQLHRATTSKYVFDGWVSQNVAGEPSCNYSYLFPCAKPSLPEMEVEKDENERTAWLTQVITDVLVGACKSKFCGITNHPSASINLYTWVKFIYYLSRLPNMNSEELSVILFGPRKGTLILSCLCM